MAFKGKGYALTKAKLAKLSDEQLKQEIKSAKYFIAQYEKSMKDTNYLFEEKRISEVLSYYHDELGKVYREIFIRKNI